MDITDRRDPSGLGSESVVAANSGPASVSRNVAEIGAPASSVVPSPPLGPQRAVDEFEPPQFAPADPLDRRRPLEWESKYPAEANKQITKEAWYLGVLLFLPPILLTVLALIDIRELLPISEANAMLLTHAISAWLAGTLGGTLFTIKWLYHSVAKQIWNIDRRLWRIFTPHVSGALAFAVQMLAYSGILRIIDPVSISTAPAVIGISFLIGYFSDSALAKLREIAETLFGATARSHEHPSALRDRGGSKSGSGGSGPNG